MAGLCPGHFFTFRHARPVIYSRPAAQLAGLRLWDVARRCGFNSTSEGVVGTLKKMTRQAIQRSETMTFRIAVVQPISHRPGEDEKNVADALRMIERAAGEGAHFICFPETYPGPWRMPATYDPVPGARRSGGETPTCMQCSAPSSRFDAKLTGHPASAYNLIVMAYPDGRAPARYRRTHPNGPSIYTGGQSHGNSNTSPASTFRCSTPSTATVRAGDSAAKSMFRK